MKNSLAIAFAIILCFASMTFAQTTGRSGAQGGATASAAKPVPPDIFVPEPGTVNYIENDTSFHVEYIIDPLDLFLDFFV